MITVTERAKEELETILTNIGADPYEGLRLLPWSGGTFVLALDTELSGDQVVEFDGLTVLLVGIEYLKVLDGKTIDCCDTGDGTVLYVR